MPRAPQPLMRLPAYLLNGALVAAGVAMVCGAVGAAAGAIAAGLALTGAVCTSLADAPVAMARGRRQLLVAALWALATGWLMQRRRMKKAQPVPTGDGSNRRSSWPICCKQRAALCSLLPRQQTTSAWLQC